MTAPSFITPTEHYMRVQLLEADYESVVYRRHEILFPGWKLWPWKKRIEGRLGGAVPDAIMISNDITEWIVVEVELASHPTSHFDDQFARIEAAQFNEANLASIALATGLNADGLLSRLILRTPPSLLCIADEATHALERACRSNGFMFAVATPYRSNLGNYALELVRSPADLRRSIGSAEVAIQIVANFGDNHLGLLPASFGTRDSITLIHQDVLHETRLLKKSGRIRLFLPAKFRVRPGRTAVLVPVDPSVGTYRVEER